FEAISREDAAAVGLVVCVEDGRAGEGVAGDVPGVIEGGEEAVDGCQRRGAGDGSCEEPNFASFAADGVESAGDGGVDLGPGGGAAVVAGVGEAVAVVDAEDGSLADGAESAS